MSRLTLDFIRDSVDSDMRYEVAEAEFGGKKISDEELAIMAAKKALDLIEKQYSVTELLQLLIELEGKAADSECSTFLETLLCIWNTARLSPEKLEEVMKSIA